MKKRREHAITGDEEQEYLDMDWQEKHGGFFRQGTGQLPRQ